LITSKQFEQVNADFEMAQATYQSLMDQMGYDALDRPTTVTDATGHTLHSEYDVQGNVTRLWNGGTRESKFDNRVVRTPGHRRGWRSSPCGPR
jgi:YD repeat-containing protein